MDQVSDRQVSDLDYYFISSVMRYKHHLKYDCPLYKEMDHIHLKRHFLTNAKNREKDAQAKSNTIFTHHFKNELNISIFICININLGNKSFLLNT